MKGNHLQAPSADAASQLTILPPHAAYNLYIQTSMLLLDACASQHPSFASTTPTPDDGTQLVVGDQDDETIPSATQAPDDEDAEEELPPLPNFLRSQTAPPAAPLSTPDGALPGSAWLDASLPLHEAAAQARRYLLDEMTPDDATQALVLYDNEERARQLALLLLLQEPPSHADDRGSSQQRSRCSCRRVHMVDRAAMHRLYPFLFLPGAQSLTLPNEIIPGRLYLGAKATANAQALRLLHITHVVSLLERRMAPPTDPRVRHLLVNIPDTSSADMDGALLQALPFMEAALREPGGRVLVHCEAGQSRSATVVVAALMANVAQIAPAPAACMGVDEALALVVAQRPNVRPNQGFKACLRRAAWMPSAAPDFF